MLIDNVYQNTWRSTLGSGHCGHSDYSFPRSTIHLHIPHYNVHPADQWSGAPKKPLEVKEGAMRRREEEEEEQEGLHRREEAGFPGGGGAASLCHSE